MKSRTRKQSDIQITPDKHKAHLSELFNRAKKRHCNLKTMKSRTLRHANPQITPDKREDLALLQVTSSDN